MDAIKQKQDQEYQQYVYKKMPKSNCLKIVLAFLVGGAICTVGQIVFNIGKLL